MLNDMNNALTYRGAPAHAKCRLLLAFNEVKKEGIVYDNNTGKLIGMCHANWKQEAHTSSSFPIYTIFHNFSWLVVVAVVLHNIRIRCQSNRAADTLLAGSG